MKFILNKYIARIKPFTVCILILTQLLCLNTLEAANISKIEIQGASKANQSFIKSYMGVPIGSEYNPDKISESMKRVYSTGYFSDIKTEFQKGTLFIKVKENPLIDQIYFYGNKTISDKDLRQEIISKSRNALSSDRIQSDINRIINLYLLSGYINAKVSVKSKKTKDGRVNIAFGITEGKKSYIKEINIQGNEVFSDRALMSQILSKPHRWWRFLSKTDTYDINRILYDMDLMRRKYNNEGYIDFKVSSYTVEYAELENAFILNINVEEGTRYKFGIVKLNIDHSYIKIDDVEDSINVKYGDWFGSSKLDSMRSAMYRTIQNKRYQFASIDYETKVNKTTETVDVTYNITNSERMFVNKITFSGNYKTADHVLRNKMRLQEGDALEDALLDVSKGNIYNTRYFKDVKVNIEEVSEGKSDVEIEVEEDSTGSIGGGVTYSTMDGFGANVSYSDINFMGEGRNLSVTAYLSQENNQFSFSQSNSVYEGRNLFSEVSVYHQEIDLQDESSYSNVSTGGSYGYYFAINDDISESLTYGIKRGKITDVDADSSAYIKASQGVRYTSYLSHSIKLDYRDNLVFTKKGALFTLETQLAGLWGTEYHLRNELTAAVYFPLYSPGDLIFSLVGIYGNIFAFNGDNVDTTESFSLGGDRLRGFDFSGVGPRDLETGDAIGGKNLIYLSAQVDFPIPGVSNYGLVMHIFADSGTVLGVDDKIPGVNISDKDGIRLSSGFGVSWKSPFGQIALDWGWPIISQDYDRTQVFYLSAGGRF